MADKNRRQFIKTFTAVPLVSGISSCRTQKIELPQTNVEAPNDEINVAAIGMGIMGFSNCRTAITIPGVKLKAACDLYTGRLERTKEVFGSDVYTTSDYKELLNRNDIDAVIISTSDHWHDRMTIDALNAGKHVYCEKPMVHKIEEGRAVLEAEKSSGKVLQIGSSRVSSELYAEAGRQYRSGIIGDLILVEAAFDRQNALGAWQYSMPTDASPETVHWDSFIGDAPPHEFDATRFFRWRNYQDYGTGVSGDMLVHFFSGFHAIIQSNGPNRIYATGGLRYWNDGRDVPDTMMVLVDYPSTDQHPGFNGQLRVNFVDGQGGGSYIRLIGSEGVMDIKGSFLTVSKTKMSEVPGYGGWDSFETFSKAQQAMFKKEYDAKYSDMIVDKTRDSIRYELEEGYSSSYQHHLNFFNAIRTDGTVVEDGAFGLRAAAPALAANVSYFEKKIVDWDPVRMKLV